MRGEAGHARQGGMCGLGCAACMVGACVAGVYMAGGHAWQGACLAGGVRGRRNGHCSGRYASYYNAFLLILSPQYF